MNPGAAAREQKKKQEELIELLEKESSDAFASSASFPHKRANPVKTRGCNNSLGGHQIKTTKGGRESGQSSKPKRESECSWYGTMIKNNS